jgi:hypothetical protein
MHDIEIRCNFNFIVWMSLNWSLELCGLNWREGKALYCERWFLVIIQFQGQAVMARPRLCPGEGHSHDSSEAIYGWNR